MSICFKTLIYCEGLRSISGDLRWSRYLNIWPELPVRNIEAPRTRIDVEETTTHHAAVFLGRSPHVSACVRLKAHSAARVLYRFGVMQMGLAEYT